MNCFVQIVINLTVSGIKAIVPCHFEIFIRNMLDQQFDKVNGRKSLPYESIVFMPIVMESDVVSIVRINSGEGDNGASKVTADIFDNGFRAAEIRFCINIKTIFIFAIYLGFGFLKEKPIRFCSLFSKTV